MTLAGKQAVRKAFENNSGMSWDTVRQEFVSVRLETLFDPWRIEDFRAGELAVELVERTYLQGLREADQVTGDHRAARAERERRADAYTARLMEQFDRKVEDDWITPYERNYLRHSVHTAYLAGCDEGRLPLGLVL